MRILIIFQEERKPGEGTETIKQVMREHQAQTVTLSGFNVGIGLISQNPEEFDGVILEENGESEITGVNVIRGFLRSQCGFDRPILLHDIHPENIEKIQRVLVDQDVLVENELSHEVLNLWMVHVKERKIRRDTSTMRKMQENDSVRVELRQQLTDMVFKMVYNDRTDVKKHTSMQYLRRWMERLIIREGQEEYHLPDFLQVGYDSEIS